MPITSVSDSFCPWALANLVASTAEFRRVTGTATEADALNRIHYWETDDRRPDGTEPMANPRPRSIIDWFERLLARSGIGTNEDSGILLLSYEFLTANLDLTGASTPPTPQEKRIAFMNSYGTINEQMFANMSSAPDKYLQLLSLEMWGTPDFQQERDEEHFGVAFQVRWR